eukprot:4980228-Pyramimonas_sp.AAC.1
MSSYLLKRPFRLHAGLEDVANRLVDTSTLPATRGERGIMKVAERGVAARLKFESQYRIPVFR